MRTVRSREAGFSLLEVLLATVMGLIIMGAIAVLIEAYVYSNRDATASGSLGAFASEIVVRFSGVNNSYFNSYYPTSCRSAFSGQPIDTANASTYDILNPDGSVFLYGAPTSAQNLVNPTWQVTSVRLIPQWTSSHYNQGETLVFMIMELSVAAVDGKYTSRPLQIPMEFIVDGAGNVTSCSTATAQVGVPVKLPTCAPSERMKVVAPGLGPTGQPEWKCESL